MAPMKPTLPRRINLRRIRHHPWVWSTLFILLAGPLNPAAWYFSLRLHKNNLNADYEVFFLAIFVPTTFIALVMLMFMHRRSTFSPAAILGFGIIGYLPTYFMGPLGMWIADTITHPTSVPEFFEGFIVIMIMGTLFPVIPFFFVIIGGPCFVCAIVFAFVCTN